jgi:hypothetical protein
MTDRINKRKTCNFAQISNKILYDSRLSFEARGIFSYIWGKPDDWKVLVKNDLVNNNNTSEYAVREALRQLKQYGYINWIRIYEKGKIVGIEYSLDDEGNLLSVDGQHEVGQHDDTQHDDQHHVYNKKEVKNTDISKKDSTKENNQSPNYPEIPNNSNSNYIKTTGTQPIDTSPDLVNMYFHQFYASYSKKGDRANAHIAFFKLFNEAVNKEAFIEELTSSLERYRQIAGANPQYWQSITKFLQDYKDYTEEYLQQCIEGKKQQSTINKNYEQPKNKYAIDPERIRQRLQEDEYFSDVD